MIERFQTELTKDQFIKAIESIKNYSDWTNQIYSFMNSYPDNTPSSDMMDNLIDILAAQTGDLDTAWIFYFCWELDFGRDYEIHKNRVQYADGRPVPLATIEDLWNLLHCGKQLPFSPVASTEVRIILT